MENQALNNLEPSNSRGVRTLQYLPVRERSPSSTPEDKITTEVTAEKQRRQSLEQGGLHLPSPHALTNSQHPSQPFQESLYW